jgi:hypothetical protein
MPSLNIYTVVRWRVNWVGNTATVVPDGSESISVLVPAEVPTVRMLKYCAVSTKHNGPDRTANRHAERRGWPDYLDSRAKDRHHCSTGSAACPFSRSSGTIWTICWRRRRRWKDLAPRQGWLAHHSPAQQIPGRFRGSPQDRNEPNLRTSSLTRPPEEQQSESRRQWS